MSKIKILTLGAATLDAFLIGDVIAVKRDVRSHDYVEQFPLGAKLELDDVVFSTGGGATNAAVTFARQGFEVSVMAKLGKDLAGAEVLKSLRAAGVNTDRVAISTEGTTAYDTCLLAPSGERTFLNFRGVSEELKTTDFNWTRLDADWLYITSLGGNLKLLAKAISAAHKHGIKVALDAGSRELAQASKLRKLLPKVTLLKGNREELGKLFSGQGAVEIVRQAAKICPYVVLTDGAGGSYASDGQQLYRAGMYKRVRVIDRTGAGDAFGSGVVAMLAREADLPAALTFGSANSTAVVRHVGAKTGILSSTAKIKPMRIRAAKL